MSLCSNFCGFLTLLIDIFWIYPRQLMLWFYKFYYITKFAIFQVQIAVYPNCFSLFISTDFRESDYRQMRWRICTHMLDVIAPAFFFDYCGANFNRWISWQTAEEELQYDNPDRLKLRKRPHRLTTDHNKKSSAPVRLMPSIWERIFTTTYTTIDTIGAPGDKMPRDRERSFLP